MKHELHNHPLTEHDENFPEDKVLIDREFKHLFKESWEYKFDSRHFVASKAEYIAVKNGIEDVRHEHTQYIICPYCGHEDYDSWEFKGEDREEREHECAQCGQYMIASRDVEVYYSTRKIS